METILKSNGFSEHDLNICLKLKKDYNGDILEEIENDHIKETFKRLSLEYKNEKKGNLPLVNIIYNHFHGALPTPRYVSGPVSFSYHTSSEYDMKIYIFGEHHGLVQNCNELRKTPNMNISQYLQDVFKNTDKFIDFYIEDELFRSKKITSMNSFLSLLRIQLSECLDPKKREKCKFNTVRTHFIDARKMHMEDFSFYTTNLNLLVEYLRSNSIKNIYDFQNINLIKELKSLTTFEEIATYVINTALGFHVIKKEFERCILNKELVLSILHRVIVEFYKQSPITIEDWNNAFTIKGSLHPNALVIFTTIQAPTIDIYTIFRMFKSFKKQPKNNFPQKPKYIIYYGGDAHSTILRKFLSKLKFLENFYTQSDRIDSKRCLDMTGIKLDFK